MNLVKRGEPGSSKDIKYCEDRRPAACLFSLTYYYSVYIIHVHQERKQLILQSSASQLNRPLLEYVGYRMTLKQKQ